MLCLKADMLFLLDWILPCGLLRRATIRRVALIGRENVNKPGTLGKHYVKPREWLVEEA
jgi:hypothetical protein